MLRIVQFKLDLGRSAVAEWSKAMLIEMAQNSMSVTCGADERQLLNLEGSSRDMYVTCDVRLSL